MATFYFTPSDLAHTAQQSPDHTATSDLSLRQRQRATTVALPPPSLSPFSQPYLPSFEPPIYSISPIPFPEVQKKKLKTSELFSHFSIKYINPTSSSHPSPYHITPDQPGWTILKSLFQASLGFPYTLSSQKTPRSPHLEAFYRNMSEALPYLPWHALRLKGGMSKKIIASQQPKGGADIDLYLPLSSLHLAQEHLVLPALFQSLFPLEDIGLSLQQKRDWLTHQCGLLLSQSSHFITYNLGRINTGKKELQAASVSLTFVPEGSEHPGYIFSLDSIQIGLSGFLHNRALASPRPGYTFTCPLYCITQDLSIEQALLDLRDSILTSDQLEKVGPRAAQQIPLELGQGRRTSRSPEQEKEIFCHFLQASTQQWIAFDQEKEPALALKEAFRYMNYFLQDHVDSHPSVRLGYLLNTCLFWINRLCLEQELENQQEATNSPSSKQPAILTLLKAACSHLGREIHHHLLVENAIPTEEKQEPLPKKKTSPPQDLHPQPSLQERIDGSYALDWIMAQAFYRNTHRITFTLSGDFSWCFITPFRHDPWAKNEIVEPLPLPSSFPAIANLLRNTFINPEENPGKFPHYDPDPLLLPRLSWIKKQIQKEHSPDALRLILIRFQKNFLPFFNAFPSKTQQVLQKIVAQALSSQKEKHLFKIMEDFLLPLFLSLINLPDSEAFLTFFPSILPFLKQHPLITKKILSQIPTSTFNNFLKKNPSFFTQPHVSLHSFFFHEATHRALLTPSSNTETLWHTLLSQETSQKGLTSYIRSLSSFSITDTHLLRPFLTALLLQVSWLSNKEALTQRKNLLDLISLFETLQPIDKKELTSLSNSLHLLPGTSIPILLDSLLALALEAAFTLAHHFIPALPSNQQSPYLAKLLAAGYFSSEQKIDASEVHNLPLPQWVESLDALESNKHFQTSIESLPPSKKRQRLPLFLEKWSSSPHLLNKKRLKLIIHELIEHHPLPELHILVQKSQHPQIQQTFWKCLIQQNKKEGSTLLAAEMLLEAQGLSYDPHDKNRLLKNLTRKIALSCSPEQQQLWINLLLQEKSTEGVEACLEALSSLEIPATSESPQHPLLSTVIWGLLLRSSQLKSQNPHWKTTTLTRLTSLLYQLNTPTFPTKLAQHFGSTPEPLIGLCLESNSFESWHLASELALQLPPEQRLHQLPSIIRASPPFSSKMAPSFKQIQLLSFPELSHTLQQLTLNDFPLFFQLLSSQQITDFLPFALLHHHTSFSEKEKKSLIHTFIENLLKLESGEALDHFLRSESLPEAIQPTLWKELVCHQEPALLQRAAQLFPQIPTASKDPRDCQNFWLSLFPKDQETPWFLEQNSSFWKTFFQEQGPYLFQQIFTIALPPSQIVHLWNQAYQLQQYIPYTEQWSQVLQEPLTPQHIVSTLQSILHQKKDLHLSLQTQTWLEQAFTYPSPSQALPRYEAVCNTLAQNPLASPIIAWLLTHGNHPIYLQLVADLVLQASTKSFPLTHQVLLLQKLSSLALSSSDPAFLVLWKKLFEKKGLDLLHAHSSIQTTSSSHLFSLHNIENITTLLSRENLDQPWVQKTLCFLFQHFPHYSFQDEKLFLQMAYKLFEWHWEALLQNNHSSEHPSLTELAQLTFEDSGQYPLLILRLQIIKNLILWKTKLPTRHSARSKLLHLIPTYLTQVSHLEEKEDEDPTQSFSQKASQWIPLLLDSINIQPHSQLSHLFDTDVCLVSPLALLSLHSFSPESLREKGYPLLLQAKEIIKKFIKSQLEIPIISFQQLVSLADQNPLGSLADLFLTPCFQERLQDPQHQQESATELQEILSLFHEIYDRFTLTHHPMLPTSDDPIAQIFESFLRPMDTFFPHYPLFLGQTIACLLQGKDSSSLAQARNLITRHQETLSQWLLSDHPQAIQQQELILIHLKKAISTNIQIARMISGIPHCPETLYEPKKGILELLQILPQLSRLHPHSSPLALQQWKEKVFYLWEHLLQTFDHPSYWIHDFKQKAKQRDAYLFAYQIAWRYELPTSTHSRKWANQGLKLLCSPHNTGSSSNWFSLFSHVWMNTTLTPQDRQELLNRFELFTKYIQDFVENSDSETDGKFTASFIALLFISYELIFHRLSQDEKKKHHSLLLNLQKILFSIKRKILAEYPSSSLYQNYLESLPFLSKEQCAQAYRELTQQLLPSSTEWACFFFWERHFQSIILTETLPPSSTDNPHSIALWASRFPQEIWPHLSSQLFFDLDFQNQFSHHLDVITQQALSHSDSFPELAQWKTHLHQFFQNHLTQTRNPKLISHFMESLICLLRSSHAFSAQSFYQSLAHDYFSWIQVPLPPPFKKTSKGTTHMAFCSQYLHKIMEQRNMKLGSVSRFILHSGIFLFNQPKESSYIELSLGERRDLPMCLPFINTLCHPQFLLQKGIGSELQKFIEQLLDYVNNDLPKKATEFCIAINTLARIIHTLASCFSQRSNPTYQALISITHSLYSQITQLKKKKERTSISTINPTQLERSTTKLLLSFDLKILDYHYQKLQRILSHLELNLSPSSSHPPKLLTSSSEKALKKSNKKRRARSRRK